MENNLVAPAGTISFIDTKPNYNISFHNETGIIGTLDFNGPEMIFTGKAEESAKVFFNWIAESFVGRLKEEFEKGRANGN